MKYYKINKILEKDNFVIPGVDGKNVKNKELFFNSGDCDYDKFYSKNYIFDYLILKNFGDPEPKIFPEELQDFYRFWGESPSNGLFRIVSKKYKDILENFGLQKSKFYKAIIKHNGNSHDYYVWQLLTNNHESYINFNETKFNNLNYSGNSRIGEKQIKTFKSFNHVIKYANENWKRAWNFEEIFVYSDFSNIDYCYFTIFNDIVSEKLKKALEKAEITGINFEELPLEIKSSDK